MNDEVNIWTYFCEVSNNLIQCCICGKGFNPEKHDLGDHLKTFHCDVILAKSKKKTDEASDRHLNFFLSGNTEKRIKDSFVWVHFSKTLEKYNKCLHCDKIIQQKNLKNLRYHVIIYHWNQISQEEKEYEKEKHNIDIDAIKEGKRRPSFVWRHFSKTLEKDNRCLHCEKIIPHREGGTTSLRDHVIKYHRKQISQEEKEREKEKNNFDIDSIEEGEKRPRKHSCHICGKLFVHKSYVRRHIDYHEKNFTHFCSYGDCRKGFVDMHALQKHAKFHSEERPFQCTTCGRGFKDNTHLKTHTRVHTGETPYHCLKCGKKFKFLATRNNHKCGIPLFLENNGDVM